MTASQPVDRVLSRLAGVRRSGDGWTACCPAHEDRRASLSVGRGDDGRVLVHCHAGCAPEQIAGAMGLEVRDLFVSSENGRHGPTIVATYDYRDERGELLYQAVRLNPKDFRLRRPDGAGGWTWKIGDTRRVLYRLPEVLAGVQAGRTIYIVEGEKDADALARGGLIATTNPMGAGKWRREYAEVLRGANVCILPDNDDAGRAHADDVARSLHDIAAEVRVLTLEGLPAKGDVSDWLAAGGTIEQLDEMAFYAPLWSGGAAAEAGQGAASATTDSRPTRFRFFDDVEAESIEKPPDLIDGLFPCGGLVVPFGPPGSGKTFIALDWAFSVQTGRPWLGRRVQQGSVVYALAEGRGGLGARVRAWKQAHGFNGRAGVHFLDEPVSLMNAADVAGFLDAVEQLGEPPVLVIFDTLARHMIGGDENSTQDMGLIVQAADRIRTATGAAVMYVHHTNKGGELERGSIALRGGADTMILLKSEDGAITLSCEKQKDAEPFERLRVRLSPVGESAAVFTAIDEWQRSVLELSPRDREALESLQRGFLDDGASASAWLKASGMPERTFFHARTRLVRGGYVTRHGEGRGAIYTISDSGRHALTATATSLQPDCNAANPVTACQPGGPYRKAPGGSDRVAAIDGEDLERYLEGGGSA